MFLPCWVLACGPARQTRGLQRRTVLVERGALVKSGRHETLASHCEPAIPRRRWFCSYAAITIQRLLPPTHVLRRHHGVCSMEVIKSLLGDSL